MIFSISGYQRSAEPVPAAAQHQVHRRRLFSPWGWATWRDRWDQFAGALCVLDYPWDVFLNIAFVESPIRMFREEVFPALSRSQHIGLVSSVSLETYAGVVRGELDRAPLGRGLRDPERRVLGGPMKLPIWDWTFKIQ